MAYGFDSTPLKELGWQLSEYRSGIPIDEETLQKLSFTYSRALVTLFDLLYKIADISLRHPRRGERYRSFLPIYIDQVNALGGEVDAFLTRGNLDAVHDFLEGVRRGAIGDEMKALAEAIDMSPGEAEDAIVDAEAGATVVNSVKEQILRRIKRDFIEDTLHSINEIISVFRCAM